MLQSLEFFLRGLASNQLDNEENASNYEWWASDKKKQLAKDANIYTH